MAPPERHVVVDGSNIATEGRSLPSLKQLDEAVRAFLADHPADQVTVVVDATFAHRVNKTERKAFDAAVDAGEIVVPPAGAVGRGDAFILQVAEKADATVLSNDSFQEFHGEHPWLFDVGRLIGAKPVEGIGWIFVDRIPVRGPESRRATRSSRSSRPAKKAGSTTTTKTRGRTGRQATTKTEQQPAPAEPVKAAAKDSGAKRARSRSSRKSSDRTSTSKTSATKAADDRNRRQNGQQQAKRVGGGDDRRGGEAESDTGKEANSPARFLEFVTRYSIGDTAVGTVDEFTSHGCYLQIASTRVYLPSKAMGDPPPSRARDVVSVGQEVEVRVQSLDAERRGINVDLVRVLDAGGQTGGQNSPSRRGRGRQKQSSRRPSSVADGAARETDSTRSTTTVATSGKKATKKAAGRKATKKPSPRKATKQATAKKAAPTKAATRTAAAKKSTKKAAPTKAATRTAAAKKSTAKKAAPTRSPAKKAAKKTTKKAAPRKATAKKAAPKKAATATPSPRAERAAARRTAKKSTKKAAPKKAAARKAAPRKANRGRR